MLSIGDLIDKLVIENIKIFTLREKLHSPDISDEEYIQLNDKMIIFKVVMAFSCNALKAGKQLDLGIDFHFHTLSVSSSFYLWNRKKRTFLESLNEHFKYNLFPKTIFFKM